MFRVPEAADIKLQEKSVGARGRESTERRRQLYSHRHKPQLIAGILRGVAKTGQVSKVDVMGILEWILTVFSTNHYPRWQYLSLT